MPSPCRSSAWLALCVLAAASCEHTQGEAAVSRTPPEEPAGDLASDPAKEVVAEPTRQAPALALAVYGSVPTDAREPAHTRFSIARTRDLYICSSWSGLEGEHFETRRFFAPGGELYYQKLIPFSTDIDEPYPFTQPVSMPHATMIRAVVPNEHGELVVCDPLAVAGAWIGDHQLTGAWHLETSLDGAKVAAGRYDFEIER